MSSIPDLSTSDIVDRLVKALPTSWFDDTAKNPGGVLYSLLTAWATNHQWMLSEILYAKNLTRLKTATNGGLDTVSMDFFGGQMPRNPGESDASYRVRIAAALFLPRVTRQAIINLLNKFVGVNPLLTQPDYPQDVCVWSDIPGQGQMANPPSVSYWDIDVHDINSGRWGDVLPYTGFIDTTIPFLNITAGRPVYGYDAGVAWGDGNSAYFDFFNELNPALEQTILNLINASIAEGTEVGVRFLPQTPALITSTIQTVLGQQSATQSNASFTSLLRSYVQGTAVFVETLPWLAHAYIEQSGVNFRVGFSTPAPGIFQVGWGALSLSFTGVYQIPVTATQQFITISLPGGIANGLVPIIQPSWNTTVWIQAFNSNSIVVGIASPGAGFLYFFLAPGFIVDVAPGTFSSTVNLPNPLPGPFPQPPTLPYAMFAMPSWNTDVSITSKTSSQCDAQFSIIAPGALTLPISPANKMSRIHQRTLRGAFKPFKSYLQPRLALEAAPAQQGGNPALLYCSVVEGIA